MPIADVGAHPNSEHLFDFPLWQPRGSLALGALNVRFRSHRGDAGGCPLLEGALTQPVTVTRRYWTELCFIKLPTIARNTSGLSLATFWNSASSEDSDAPGCFSIKSSISFSAASMVLDLSGVMISGFYRRRASTLCRELRLSALLKRWAPRNGKRPRASAAAELPCGFAEMSTLGQVADVAAPICDAQKRTPGWRMMSPRESQKLLHGRRCRLEKARINPAVG